MCKMKISREGVVQNECPGTFICVLPSPRLTMVHWPNVQDKGLLGGRCPKWMPKCVHWDKYSNGRTHNWLESWPKKHINFILRLNRVYLFQAVESIFLYTQYIPNCHQQFLVIKSFQSTNWIFGQGLKNWRNSGGIPKLPPVSHRRCK